MAIINQKYGRQGNANFTLYRLASSSLGSSIFHDITTDGNRVACTSLSSDCEIPAGAFEPIGRTAGHDSTAGYDMVTGLGSIDIANLVNNWSKVAYVSTTTTLDLNGGTGQVTAVHGTAITAVVGVNSSSGSPTGDVSLIGSTENGSIYLGSLQSGSVTGQVNTLSGGSYTVSAHYAGDTQFAPSDSTSVNVSISPELSTTKVSILNYDPTTGIFGPPPASVPYGSLLLLRADVKGQSGYGEAAGSATFKDGTNSLGPFTLNAQGYTEDIPSNLLIGGAHTVNASYSGDASFNASSGAGNIMVTPGLMSCGSYSNTTALRPGWVLILNAFAELYEAKPAPTLGNMVAPTGTISIYSGTTLIAGPTMVTGFASQPSNGITLQLPWASIPQLTFQLSQLTSISNPITISYSGDSNYSSCTSPPLNLTYSNAPIPSQMRYTLSAYQNIPVGAPISLSAVILSPTEAPTGEPAYPAPTGTVQLAIDGTNVGAPTPVVAGPAEGNELIATANVTIPTTGLAVGMHSVSLSYSGDANYQALGEAGVYIWLVQPGFSMSLNPSTLTVINGQITYPTSVQVVYANGYSGNVAFSCSGLPAESSCVFSPTSLSAQGNVSLTISTTQAQSVGRSPVASNQPQHSRWIAGAGSISVGLLLFALVPRRRRKNLGLWMCMAGVIFCGVSSCGGGSGGSTQSSPNYFSTVTSLAAASNSPSKGSTDTVTATVTAVNSATVPSGTVQFSVDNVNSGSPVALSNATAQFPASFTTAGTHTIGAAYSGDATHLSSTSNDYTITVPYTTGSVPGSYSVIITGTSGSVTRSATLRLIVQ